MTFPILGGNGAVAGYSIDNSLRFNDGDSPKLKRTTTGSGTQSTYTFSTWCKRSSFGSYQYLFSHRASGGANAYGLAFDRDSEKLYVYNGSLDLTTAVYRDASAWYHIVLSVSSGSYTLYVNGSSVKTGSAQSIVLGESMTIGAYEYSTTVSFLDGYMAETYLIDGTAKAPTDFGEFDSDSGIWKPISYSGSYGTNGFKLNFSDSGSLGADSSGNGNNFTPTNLASTDQTTDTPTNNFATINALQITNTNQYLSEGNLQHQTSSSANWLTAPSNMASNNGKWYAECKIIDNTYTALGFMEIDSATDNTASLNTNNVILGNSTGGWAILDYYSNIVKKNNNTNTTLESGTNLAQNDIVMFAMDLDNQKIWWGRNGTWFASGNPSTGSNSAYSNLTSGKYYTFASCVEKATVQWNFGNPPFSISSGNSDGNGYGNFEYAPPSGYLALCTQNLATVNSYTIDDGSEHFNTVLWSGNSVDDRSITGVGFAPDLVSIKNRNASTNFYWYDTTRGADNQLLSNASNSESTITNKLQAFESDGFQLGTSSEVNSSSNTYVGWSWKAGGTTPSQTYTVKVVSDSGNKYRFDDFGTSAVTLDLQEGGTYTFDQSDSSNSGHPLRFSTTSDGTHGSGSEYTTGVTTTGTPGSAGAKTVITVSASAPTLYYYCSVHSGMGGQANTNSTHGSSNFAGSIQSVAQANTTAGFSIVTYTGTGSNATVGHGLGIKPQFIIVKNRSDGSNWEVYSEALDNTGNTYLALNGTVGGESDFNMFNDTAPTTSVFSVGTRNETNGSGDNIVAYCFAGIEGYSKMGKYTGTGNSNGAYVYTGFRPAWVMVKQSSASGNSWEIRDNLREPFNDGERNILRANTSDAEQTGAFPIDFLSNGFKTRYFGSSINKSGSTYIYMAFAENPFVSSSGVPVTAR